MIEPQYFLHISNIIFVFAYSVKEVLWLRILALCGTSISLPYYYLQTSVLWEPIGWATIFMTINGYHVYRLWMERRPVELSADEAKLYELTFFPLTPRHFLDLVRLGHWADLKAGDVLIRPGHPIDEVAVALTESININVGKRFLGRFAAGGIVGASGLFDARPAQFEAIAGEPCRALKLRVGAIKRYSERDGQLARTFERIAREDFARKLEQVVGLAATIPSTPASASQPPAGRNPG